MNDFTNIKIWIEIFEYFASRLTADFCGTKFVVSYLLRKLSSFNLKCGSNASFHFEVYLRLMQVLP